MNNTGTKQVRIIKKLHFEEKKTESIYHVKNNRYLYLLNKYINCNMGGLRCGTSTIVDIRRLKVNRYSSLITGLVTTGT